MGLRDQLERAIENTLQEDPSALEHSPEHGGQGRGEAADAMQHLITARNALLDAASRFDRATGNG